MRGAQVSRCRARVRSSPRRSSALGRAGRVPLVGARVDHLLGRDDQAVLRISQCGGVRLESRLLAVDPLEDDAGFLLIAHLAQRQTLAELRGPARRRDRAVDRLIQPPYPLPEQPHLRTRRTHHEVGARGDVLIGERRRIAQRAKHIGPSLGGEVQDPADDRRRFRRPPSSRSGIAARRRSNSSSTCSASSKSLVCDHAGRIGKPHLRPAAQWVIQVQPGLKSPAERAGRQAEPALLAEQRELAGPVEVVDDLRAGVAGGSAAQPRVAHVGVVLGGPLEGQRRVLHIAIGLQPVDGNAEGQHPCIEHSLRVTGATHR